MKKYFALIFIFLSGCAGDDVHQSTFNVNKLTRVADANGWYHFAGFYYKGQLIGGNPHGNGRCIEFSEHVGKEYLQKETACEFNNGERIDQQYVKKINDDNMRRSSSAAQSQREHDQQQAERAARAREDEKDRIQADRESYRKFQQDQHKFDAVVAQANRQISETADRGVRQRQQQIQQGQAETDAAWARAQRARSSSIAGSGSAPYVANSNGAASSQQDQERQRKELQVQLNASQQSRNRNEEQLQQQARINGRGSNNSASTTKEQTAKNAPEVQTITVEYSAIDSKDFCHIRNVALSQAQAGLKINARKECEELGKGWRLQGERFGGYLEYRPCTGGETGNFKVFITKAMFNCKR